MAPAPDIANDASAFERAFRDHLTTLTFNSKQIITMLTIMADDYKDRMSTVVARVLDTHITSSPPQFRLPSLYLLDSICKNIGYPYHVLWAPHIARIFMDSYRVVDLPVKAKLEDLLATWRDSGSDGGPLFGFDAQKQLEKALYSSAEGHRSDPRLQSAPGSAGQSMQQQSKVHSLLRRINSQLELGSQEQYRHPDNVELVSRLEALRGLRQVVQTGTLPEDDYSRIDEQLSAMEHAPTPQPPGPAPGPPPAGVTTPERIGGLPSNLAASLNALGSGATSDEAAASGNVASDLFSKLMASGLLGNVAQSQPQEPEQDDEYTRMIMTSDIKLTVHELQRDLSSSLLEDALLLRGYLPAQCRQCARRFPTGDKGQRSKDEHLDWHFKQNKRVKDSLARGQSRQWFPKLEEFIRGGFDDSPPTAGVESGAENGGAGGSVMTVEQEKVLKAKFASLYVIAPTDPTVAAQPCPICKESFKSVYNEEEEEWVWYDAIEVNSSYYHASCYHSAESLSASVKRDSTPADSSDTTAHPRSRSTTPALAGTVKDAKHGAAALDPVSRLKEEEGISSPKRKREEMDDPQEGEQEAVGESGSPPAKKVAINREGDVQA
ncbi:hypothetical protein K437DRAFT_219630 [Tilletiaria anomala UBC 951]|uniref:CID domain-containing protein n=1 Tax=Tilletiaria anomala (strain ATCC 24038 / CBS 436.72 / UBC 951) TaxID=1037660 RepID=A0A066WPM3_TILAU|nr:uncharacterized protein K437DRAFT_219630 [Tilletiaria anomala UBC 951]KDN52939.1 hypothetical protein K437DRAFT_219630 [Tilletiaria anomala UBC 951]